MISKKHISYSHIEIELDDIAKQIIRHFKIVHIQYFLRLIKNLYIGNTMNEDQ